MQRSMNSLMQFELARISLDLLACWDLAARSQGRAEVWLVGPVYSIILQAQAKYQMNMIRQQTQYSISRHIPES